MRNDQIYQRELRDEKRTERSTKGERVKVKVLTSVLFYSTDRIT